MDIIQRLMDMRDEKYRTFTSQLIPNVSIDTMIGVRLPNVKALARELVKNGEYVEFISSLPHKYFEEYHLHSYIISIIKDFDKCIIALDELLPYIDNWSVCDSLRPKCFLNNKEKALIHINRWLESEHTYTKRFAIEMLMVYYLNEDFDPEYLDTVSKIDAEDYYLKMMIAWYFATALAKQSEAAIPYLENHLIKDQWIHNKAIQKACESYRVDIEIKEKLKNMKR